MSTICTSGRPTRNPSISRTQPSSAARRLTQQKALSAADAIKKALVLRWFDSLGSSGEMTFTKEAQGWKYNWTSTDPSGGEYLWNGTITLDAGIQRVHETDREIKGEAKPDHELTWKRKS